MLNESKYSYKENVMDKFMRFVMAFIVLAMLVASGYSARADGLEEKKQQKQQARSSSLHSFFRDRLSMRSVTLREKQLVRVSLGENAGIFSIGISGMVYVYEPDSKERQKLVGPATLTVRKDGKKIKIGDLVFEKEVILDPQRDEKFTYGKKEYDGVLHLIAGTSTIRVVEHTNVEDYLLGVVSPEMYPTADIGALRAQAVAARSYALAKVELRKGNSQYSYDVVDNTNDQADQGIGNIAQSVFDAVQETYGEVLFKNGKIMMALYSANCGGNTITTPENWCCWGSPEIEGVTCGSCRPGYYSGHRRGMCQVGAMNKALAGMDYKDILSYYYDRGRPYGSPKSTLRIEKYY